jgi:hypothetical protein
MPPLDLLPGKPNERVRGFVSRLSPQQREALLAFTKELARISASDQSRREKAKSTYRAAKAHEIVVGLILLLIRFVFSTAYEHCWRRRSWAFRATMGAIGAAAAAFGSEGAGIAAFGTANGVPLWMVCGGGGALLAVLIQELESAIRRETT